jgi:hypothetical protein
MKIDVSLPINAYGEQVTDLLPPPRKKTSNSVRKYKYKYNTFNGNIELTHRVIFKLGNVKIPDSWPSHHINGNTKDNRPSNLVALPPRFHTGLHYYSHRLINGIWYKLCKHCRRWLELNNFYTNYKKNGRGRKSLAIKYFCKECDTKLRVIRRKRKEAPNARA